MKKHPVDDLFARKLSDWQPKASDGLWDQIEARQHKVPQRLGWYWYATAASVSILVLVGYMVWQSEAVETSHSKEQIFAARPIKPPARPRQLAEINSSTKATGLDRSGKARRLISTNPSATQNHRAKSTQEASVAKSSIEPLILREKIEVATIEKKEITPESLIAENAEGTSLQLQAIQSPITKATPSIIPAGRVLVARVEPALQIEDGPKSSKFIRVLRQLKNAKQGEAIEWEQVGFNPKELMARADERLKNEEEKISKKYQELKDKTKL